MANGFAPELEFDDEDMSSEERQEVVDALNAEQDLSDEMDGLYDDMTAYD